MTDQPSKPVGVRARLSFHCPGCGRELTAGLEAAGVEAPCPSCGTPARAPVLGQPATPVSSPQAPAPNDRQRGVPADGILDRRQAENRENANLLRILLSVALVLAVCTVVALVVRSHFLQ
jgi:hypothetical protein